MSRVAIMCADLLQLSKPKPPAPCHIYQCVYAKKREAMMYVVKRKRNQFLTLLRYFLCNAGTFATRNKYRSARVGIERSSAGYLKRDRGFSVFGWLIMLLLLRSLIGDAFLCRRLLSDIAHVRCVFRMRIPALR